MELTPTQFQDFKDLAPAVRKITGRGITIKADKFETYICIGYTNDEQSDAVYALLATKFAKELNSCKFELCADISGGGLTIAHRF